jgi:hypothetical protein
MKVERQDVVERFDRYPLLMVNPFTDTVVLFTGKNTGVCVHPGCHPITEKVGVYKTDWAERNFKKYPGRIVLTNP